jgi:DNA-binding FadR family transcriptional regulator
MREIGMGIVSGGFPQTSILPGDAELMLRFKVSRTVLREAMKTLAGKGLIQAKARIGTRVRDRADWNLFDRDVLLWHAEQGLDSAFVDHLHEIRMVLEPEAAALAAQRRSPEQLEGLYAWVDGMAAETERPGSFVTSDLNFHLAVAAAAGNPFLRSISTIIEVALNAVLTISSPADDAQRLVRSVADHRAIADAIARRDSDGARESMRRVIREGLEMARVVSRKK